MSGDDPLPAQLSNTGQTGRVADVGGGLRGGGSAVVVDDGLAERLAGVPARRRRTALVVVPLLAALLAGAALYLSGGDRLTGAGGGVSAPVDIGAEFHTTVFLDTDGGTVELVSARPVGATPDLEVELTLVELTSGASGIGAARGPLDDERYRQLPLEGHRLRSSSNGDPRLLVDVRLVPGSLGIHQLRAIEVTYRAGFLRERTEVLDVPVCLTAWTDWAVAPESGCPLPGQ